MVQDISRWIDAQAAFAADKPAIEFEGLSLGYGAFRDLISDTARMLKHELKVGRGDRVALLGYNGIEFLALVFATARLGAMFTPLNWRLAPREHDFILEDCSASVLVAEPDFRDHADSFRAKHPDCRFVGLGHDGDGWLSYETLLETARGKRDRKDDANPHVDLSAPHLVVYTSGTTGKPKGAVLTQNALFWNAVNATHMHDLTSSDRVLTVLPMFHVGGLNIQTLPAFHAGATVILHRRFDPGATLQAIAADQPSLLVLVPATIAAVQGHGDWTSTDLGCLRALTTGSSAVPSSLIDPFHARGIPVLQVYGSTETAPVAVYLRADEAMDKLGTTGRPALHCQLRIVDDIGQDVPEGRSGEVLIKGPNVMYEYWGNEAATREALRDGWFHSGDVGHLDEDGCLVIDDRKKDVIISGGENIYPAELEEVLHGIDGIAEAAVVGRKDPRWGECPVAVVVRRDGDSPDEAAVLAAFEDRLARYKHPRDVVFMEALPRNVMGKVQKFRLREMI